MLFLSAMSSQLLCTMWFSFGLLLWPYIYFWILPQFWQLNLKHDGRVSSIVLGGFLFVFK